MVPHPLITTDPDRGPWILLHRGGVPVLAWGSHRCAQDTGQLGYELVVLCAVELQDPSDVRGRPGTHVIRCGFDDYHLTAQPEVPGRIARVAREVAARIRRDRVRTLVTCHMGLNRSALVAGAIRRHVTGEDGRRIYQQIKRRRPAALQNLGFVALMHSWEAMQIPKRAAR